MALDDRLKYVRNRAKLTLAEVSKTTGIGQSSISEFENGKRDPSLSQLRSLAQSYNRSTDFFLSDDPIPEEMVLWRMKPEENAEEVETQFLRFCEQYRNLEEWNNDVIVPKLPESESSSQEFSYNDAEELARHVHRSLQLGNYPGQSLLRVLEEICGIKVFHLDFEPTGTAACTKSDEIGVAILLNSGNRRWRRNFDLAHELFHLLTWLVFRTEVDEENVQPTESEEKLATCFARHLLMPVEALKAAVNNDISDGTMTYSRLFAIARQFDVSVEALIWHIKFVYNLKDNEKLEQIISRAAQLTSSHEERTNDTPPPFPARYQALAIKAVREGKFSIGRFADYMQISRREARKYILQEGGDSEKIQLASA